MGRWLAEFQDSDQLNTDVTDNTFVTSVLAVKNPTLRATNTNEEQNQRPHIRQDVDAVFGKVLQGMPTTLDEIKNSRLFNENDLKMISDGELGVAGLRLYIGSWLLADGQFPFVLHTGWAKKLQERGPT